LRLKVHDWQTQRSPRVPGCLMQPSATVPATNACFAELKQQKGQKVMHVLVAVASRHGSTREIADAIAQALDGPGVDAEVRTVEDVPDLDRYDAVVLGSAIYMGNWESAASQFVQRHHSKLVTMPVWLFSSGPVGKDEHPGQGDPPKVVEIAQLTRARGHQMFAGKLDRHDLNLGERLVVNVVHAPDGDFRNWSAIRAWADEIGAALKSTAERAIAGSTSSDSSRPSGFGSAYFG
jgi:menaquinone-dependent protoporphyrinogen oxidase